MRILFYILFIFITIHYNSTKAIASEASIKSSKKIESTVLLPSCCEIETQLGQAQGSGIPIKRFYYYDKIILEASKHHQIDPLFIKAILLIESNLNPHAVSRANARGIAQLMYATAKTLGVSNRHDPSASIWGCAALVKKLGDLFNGDMSLIAAAYNAGPGAIIKAGLRVPRIHETQVYVPEVMSTWERMKMYHHNNYIVDNANK